MSPFTIYFEITVSFALLVSSSNGLCCGYNPVAFGVGCCGYGACNVFCCNCKGHGCNPYCQSQLNSGHAGKTAEIFDTKVVAAHQKEENSPHVDFHANQTYYELIHERDATLAVFSKIDKNNDSVIDFKEAVFYYRNIMTGLGSPVSKKQADQADDDSFSKEFNKIDSNEDGVIQQCEFDSSFKCES